ncbi:MAG: hypothetical protein KatS3mg036_0147 [Ignavibacterium sp.]|nr:MAG: hypothetical protein KatS3mg036_0147 [Ignavibacterium sp.]
MANLFIPRIDSLIPGFVQTHIHLCQTLFRGLADDLELLDWLQLKIMPFEFAHDKNSMNIFSFTWYKRINQMWNYYHLRYGQV